MKVFVAGATGVVGRRAVGQLVASGHDVTGVARSPEKGALLERLGATPAFVDLFDATAVKDAVAGSDAVCNLATSIPPPSKAVKASAWATNERIRRDASRHLVDAAIAAGAGRFVQESIAFGYPDCGDRWIDESVPLDLPVLTAAVLEAERQAARFTEHGGAGVVLRFGMFYAPDAVHTVDMVRLVRAHVAPSFAPPGAYQPAIHADDAAAAVVAALSAEAGAYNIVDDEPVTSREAVDALAAAVGVRRAFFALAPVGRLGRSRFATLTRSQRVTNRRFRDATGWTPRHPSVREGWPRVVEQMGDA